jgi:prepilin-type N-terminal cleavage/methylation domain-containing protein
MNKQSVKQAGFTLVELAIVLVILGLVLSALLLPLQAQRAQIAQSQTQATLENAKRALIGFAQTNGRLPCPAIAGSNGIESESPVNSGTCTQEVGFLPAATLGVEPTNAQGFALDGWNNPIRYAITQKNNAGVLTTHYTTMGEMANQGIENLQPNLRVCANATNLAAGAGLRCSGAPETNYLINNAVVVIYSLGATASQAIGGADETANLNDADANGIIDDGIFVSHEPVVTANNEFDHIVTWISPYVLYNAMIQAGQLH